MPTFAEVFCKHYEIPPERFAAVMFRRCLHRRAWLLFPLFPLLGAEFFEADYNFIRDVGRLTRTDALTDELADFYSHPSNLTFARRRLRMRVSGRRVSRLVHRLMPERRSEAATDSLPPFRR